jgi:thiamine-monophosphate kinase
LADAARRLAGASGLGVVVDAGRVPVHAGALTWAEANNMDPVRLAVSGGEDYELAFAVGPRQRRRFVSALRRLPTLPVTLVGRFTSESGAWLDRDGTLEPLPRGFRHF